VGILIKLVQIIKYKPEDFIVISGDDAIALPMIALGAHGVISVVANAYPLDYSNMIRLCLQDNYEEARILHLKYIDIINSMFTEGSPSGVKAYLSEMGLCSNQVRLPVWPVNTKHLERIKELMKQIEAGSLALR
jgi:4-hydroxy-tetrahydrodipicolinate synthase